MAHDWSPTAVAGRRAFCSSGSACAGVVQWFFLPQGQPCFLVMPSLPCTGSCALDTRATKVLKKHFEGDAFLNRIEAFYGFAHFKVRYSSAYASGCTKCIWAGTVGSNFQTRAGHALKYFSAFYECCWGLVRFHEAVH